MSNDERTFRFEEITRSFLRGEITHEERVRKLKKLGFTGAEVVDLNNDFMDRYEKEQAPFIPNDSDIDDFISS